jgi:hypothetical protein
MLHPRAEALPGVVHNSCAAALLLGVVIAYLRHLGAAIGQRDYLTKRVLHPSAWVSAVHRRLVGAPVGVAQTTALSTSGRSRVWAPRKLNVSGATETIPVTVSENGQITEPTSGMLST